MTWQIPEEVCSTPITLFEAVADLDAGPIHLQQQITLQGHELVGEWRVLQACAPSSSVWPGLIATRRR